MPPEVSVITPTYNHERYIGKCIESVLNQTFSDLEMIIIDDESTDKTSSVVSSYQSKDERIRYFRQKRKGAGNLAETYNKGIRLARGKYIAILEGDDFWQRKKLEKQIPGFEDENVVLSYGNRAIVNEKGEEIGRKNPNLNGNIYQNKPVGKILDKLLIRNIIPSETVVCRKSSLLKIGGFKQPEEVTFDYPTWLELSLIGKFHPLNDLLGFWRRYGEQITQRKDPVKGRLAFNKYRMKFFDRLPESIQKRLRVNRKDLSNEYNEQLALAYLNRGRINLANKKWEESRKSFVKAIEIGKIPTKVKSILGIMLSLVEKDLEEIAYFLGKPRLR